MIVQQTDVIRLTDGGLAFSIGLDQAASMGIEAADEVKWDETEKGVGHVLIGRRHFIIKKTPNPVE